LLLISATDPRRRDRFWLGADLALEVESQQKRERDLVDKRGDYAKRRAPESWIVNGCISFQSHSRRVAQRLDRSLLNF
jgi:Uma2 family endonuclease